MRTAARRLVRGIVTTAPRIFADRAAGGAALAEVLRHRRLPLPLLVLALPRGGVAVAVPVAQALRAPLDVLIVRKVGAPGNPELASGAVASGGITVWESTLHRDYPELAVTLEPLAEAERREIERREGIYRAGLPPLALAGKTVILVDDGLATGSTMLAAVRAARAARAGRIVVAAPVASPEAARLVRAEADETVILQTPVNLFAVGQWYGQFEQLDDVEVCRLLELARAGTAATAGDGHRDPYPQ